MAYSDAQKEATARYNKKAYDFISGVTIYRINEPTELFNSIYTNPWLYSAVYNGSYVLIDLVLCLVILAVLSTPMRKYLRGDDLKAMRGE